MMIRETSLISYRDILKDGLLGHCQKIVFTAYYTRPKSTDKEIQRYTGLPINNLVARRNELYHMGLLCPHLRRKCKISGRNVMTWFVPDEISKPKIINWIN